jgi:hypothetical protein
MPHSGLLHRPEGQVALRVASVILQAAAQTPKLRRDGIWSSIAFSVLTGVFLL